MSIKKVVVSAVAVSLFVLACGGGGGSGKGAIESGIRKEFQEKMNSDPAYKESGVKVQKVTLVQTDPFSYEGAATVLIDGNTFDVPVVAKGDKSAFKWEMDALMLDLETGMVLVKGGTFMMGCTPEQGGDCEGDERPAHSVTVGDFRIMKYEVTQRLWREIAGSNPSRFKGDNLPVENVSWNDVQRFIEILNGRSGKTYRLPTEAEWEYAARGGNKSGGFKYSGSNNIDDVAWYSSNSGSKTNPVGQKKANELGIYDMSGNVWEWVSDWYGSNYYASSPSDNPTGPETGSYRVYRGGSWDYDARSARVSIRYYNYPDYRFLVIGFRLVVASSSP